MWEARIKKIAEKKYPINLGDVPGKARDCRIKIHAQTMLREKCVKEIYIEISKLAASSSDKDIFNNSIEFYFKSIE